MLSSIEGNVQEDAKDGRTKKTVVYQGTGQMMPASNITTTAWPTNFLFMAVGAVAGSVVAWMLTERKCNKKNRNHEQADSDYNRSLLDKRERLPSLVLLLRHGESEANADNTLFRLKPDNQINLTTQGRAQARDAGRRIEKFFQRFETETNRMIQRVHIHVSPFERTLQTSAEARRFFEHRVVRTQPESRIREQEFGNMSNKDSAEHREEQKKVGRFWYRFPTGESGCDVLDRVKSWWSDSFLTVNERVGYDPIDAVVVVTHGLTMRFLLMQLYNWSPNTFHSVWNASNCALYILVKDLSKPGISPYVLDVVNGDKPESSIDLVVTRMKKDENTGEQVVFERQFKLYDYLSIPPPRTIQIQAIKERLVEQYPHEFTCVEEILNISFRPFTKSSRSSTEKINSSQEWRRVPHPIDTIVEETQDLLDSQLLGQGEDDKIESAVLDDGDDENDDDENDEDIARIIERAEPEKSLRWPCKYH